MFKKLRKSFVLLNMVIISIMMIVAFTVIYFSMYQNTMANNKDKVSRLPIGAIRVVQGNQSEGTIFSGGVLPSDYSLSFNLILNRNKQIVKINSYVDMPIEIYQTAAINAIDSKKEYGTMKLDGRIWMFHIKKNEQFMQNNNGNIFDPINSYIINYLDITESATNLNSLLFTFIIVGALMLFIIYMISVYFAKKSVKRIEEAWNKQKQFIADASHEFKTPIAVIEANTDALLLEEKKKSKKWIDYIKIETNRMNKLVTDLLYLAKTEDMDIEFENIPFNVSETLNEVILSMEAIIYEKKINLTQNIEENLLYKGDSSKLSQVMIILLDNAIKYTNESGQIKISLRRIDKNIEFSIENTGEGITKEDLTKVFDRFYRADTARTGTNNSYGLGLSIAKVVIERMNGKISVESISGKTTKFTIILKIK